MTNTEEQQLREQIERALTVTPGEIEEAILNGGHVSVVGKIMSLFQSHESQVKQDIFKQVEEEVIGADEPLHKTRAWDQATRNNLREELRASLKALEEKEIGGE